MDVLNDDLVRKCLLGVAYKSHDNLKAVCKTWKAMVNDPKFYADRKISGTSEQVICLILRDRRVSRLYSITIYDPLKGTWEMLPAIDNAECPGIPMRCECVAVNRKLFLVGGLHPVNNSVMKSVYIYDFVSARWSRGADMPTARYAFASSVSSFSGLIYVAGGVNKGLNPLAAAEAYNVEEDKWEILPPMIQQHGEGCRGIFSEGKFSVISRREFHINSEVFDPGAGEWRMCEDMWSFDPSGGSWRSWEYMPISLRERCVVATSSSELYVFIKQDIMKYNAEKNVWTAVTTLPRDIHFLACVTQWRDWHFVSGFDVCYLFNPSTGQLKEVNSGGGGSLLYRQQQSRFDNDYSQKASFFYIDLYMYTLVQASSKVRIG